MEACALTFDVDWAPDWSVEAVVNICRDAGIPATFFATHDSPVTRVIADDPLFELAIHPNLMPGSSHGIGPGEVFSHCLAFAPGATSMRTHGLVFSSDLLSQVARTFPQLRIDSSLMLPLQPGIRPVTQYVRGQETPVIRLPIFWSDYYACLVPGWDWRRDLLDAPGLKVLIFHPIHVALNTECLDRYDRLKADPAAADIRRTTMDVLARHRWHGDGAGTFLERLLDRNHRRPWMRMRDVVNPGAHA